MKIPVAFFCVITSLLLICTFQQATGGQLQSLDTLEAVYQTTQNVKKKAAIAYNLAYSFCSTEPTEALRYCDSAINHYGNTENKLWQARSFHLRYDIAVNLGDIKLAALSLNEASNIYGYEGSKIDLASAQLDFASLAILCKDYNSANEYLQIANPELLSIRDARYVAQWSAMVGYWHKEQGHWFAAIPFYKQAIHLFEKDIWNKAASRLHLSTCYIQTRAFDSAQLQLDQLLTPFGNRIDSGYFQLHARHKVGLIQLHKGETIKALTSFKKTIVEARKQQNTRVLIAALNNAASILLAKENKKEENLALSYLQEVLSLKDQVIAPAKFDSAYSMLISYYKAKGEPSKALYYSEGSKQNLVHMEALEALKTENRRMNEWQQVMTDLRVRNEADNQLAVKRATNIAVGSIVLLVIVVITSLALFLLYRSRLQKRIIKALEATNDASQEKIRLLKKSNETDDWILKFIANRKR